MTFLKSLFRHFKLTHWGALLGANVFCILPFLVALVGPLLLAASPSWGMVALLTGFVLTGQALAVSGRLLDRRFEGNKPEKGGLIRAFSQGWAEGFVMTGFFLGFFSLSFNSVPFYWAQGTAFSVFSLAVLAFGAALLLGGLPYYLPIRRREGLGLLASMGRSFRLMNANPWLSLTTAGLGLFALLVNLGSLGLFPGFAGLAALHQAAYDRAIGEVLRSALPERPGT